jgi:hypothetical protein
MELVGTGSVCETPGVRRIPERMLKNATLQVT